MSNESAEIAEQATNNKESVSKFSHTFRALKHKNYSLFFIGQIISLSGTWMQSIAQSWLVYRLTGSVVLLGLVGFASQIPVFFTRSDWRRDCRQIQSPTHSDNDAKHFDVVGFYFCNAHFNRIYRGLAFICFCVYYGHFQRFRYSDETSICRRYGRQR